MSELFDVALRLRVTSPFDKRAAAQLDHLFRELQSSGLGDDITSPDSAGRFTIWLQVSAASMQAALGVAVERIVQLQASNGEGHMLAFDLLGAEVEQSDAMRPAPAVAVL